MVTNFRDKHKVNSYQYVRVGSWKIKSFRFMVQMLANTVNESKNECNPLETTGSVDVKKLQNFLLEN